MDRKRPATRAAESGVTGDERVAGPPPKPPVADTPGPPSPRNPAEPPRNPAEPPRTPAEPPRTAAEPPHAPAEPPRVPAEPPHAPAEPPAGLLDPREAERLRKRWHEVQSGFVDDPGGAVRRADELASDAVDALGHAIATHRRTLSENGAADREHPDTERLRQALRGYRDLLNRVIDA